MISTRRSMLAALLASPALGLTEINFASADTTLDLDLTPSLVVFHYCACSIRRPNPPLPC
jgi:hypothetical protein